jgi:hypothetical protein
MASPIRINTTTETKTDRSIPLSSYSSLVETLLPWVPEDPIRNMSSKGFPVIRATTPDTCTKQYRYDTFCSLLKSACDRSAGYYWLFDGSKSEPESLHHFLGLSYDSCEDIKQIILAQPDAPRSIHDLVAKLAGDIGGKPFAEASKYNYPYLIEVEGEIKKGHIKEPTFGSDACWKAV